jgi:hypothetical protein
MEAILGISLCSYLYLRLVKNAMSFLLSLMFPLQQNQTARGENRFRGRGRRGKGKGRGEVAQTMYIILTKCKNDTIKKELKKTNITCLCC